MHYLVTGHTGFKGAWLVQFLRTRGHQVSGLALDPVENALFTADNTRILFGGAQEMANALVTAVKKV